MDYTFCRDQSQGIIKSGLTNFPSIGNNTKFCKKTFQDTYWVVVIIIVNNFLHLFNPQQYIDRVKSLIKHYILLKDDIFRMGP